MNKVKIYEGQRFGDDNRPVIRVKGERSGHFHEYLLPISGRYSPAADWGLRDDSALETAYSILCDHLHDCHRADRYVCAFTDDVIARMPNVRWAFNSHFIDIALQRYNPHYAPEPEAVFHFSENAI